MITSANDFYSGWRRMLRHVIKTGDEASPRGMKVKERIGTTLRINDLRRNVMVHPLRDLNYRFMVAEWLWIAAGRSDVRTVERYNKQIAKFSDNGVTFEGAYGPRLHYQWNYVINAIKQDPDTRQAVATIWMPRPAKSKDIPCTVACQFLLRGGRLHSVWTMRSQDLWLGLPYDFFNFSQLTNCVAAELGVDTGSLTLNVGSSHLYEGNFAQAEAVIGAGHEGSTVTSPLLPRWPDANGILDFAEAVHEERPMSTALQAPPVELGYARALASKGKVEALAELQKIGGSL